METLEFLYESIAVLGAALLVVLLSARLRLPPVVGFLLSGMLIGPSGLALVPEAEQVEIFAEIGVVLLLFVIGLQIDLAHLRHLGRSFLLGGTLQWAVTTGLAMGIVLTFGLPLPDALFIGFVVSLSSTAVVLKEYQARREQSTPQGRIVLGVLLFQDLLMAPMIAVTPMLAGSIEASAGEIALRFGAALATLALVFWLARILMPWLGRLVARTRLRELWILGALSVCLAMAWFTARLELSLALGAFLAGLLIAETDYRHQVAADITPFRDLFASVFFVAMGMLVDLQFAARSLPTLVGLAALLVLGKALTATGALRLAGYPTRIALVCGVGLAQIGEFSFVLMEVGRANGLLQGARFQSLLVAAVLTVAVTPLLVRGAPAIGERTASLGRRPGRPSDEPDETPISSHVVVIGYGMNGSLLARVLAESHIRHLVVELDPETVRRARRERVPILFGDAVRPEILERAGVERAKIVVIAISDYLAVQRSLQAIREIAPDVEIIVRTSRYREIGELETAGADQVVAEEFESAIEIFTRVLAAYHVPRNVIRAETRALRGESYRMLRSAPLGQVSEAVLRALEAGTTDLYRVTPECRAAGVSLTELGLRQHTGTSAIAVVRGEESFLNPSADLRLEPGDCLVLVGAHDEIDRAFRFLDGGEPAA